MASGPKLSELIALASTIDPASYTTVQYSDGIDLKKFHRAAFFVLLGNIAATTTVNAKLQGSADNSTFTDISGKSITQLGGTDDNKQVILEVSDEELLVVDSTYRYVRCAVTPATDLALVGVAGFGFKQRYVKGADNDLSSVAEIVA